MSLQSCSKILLGLQPCRVVEWQVNQRSEDHLCPYHQETHLPDTRDRDGPQNVCLPTIQSTNMAVSPRIFYGIQSLWKLEIICYKGGLYQGCQDFLKLWEPPQNSRYQNAKMKQVPYSGTTKLAATTQKVACVTCHLACVHPCLLLLGRG